MANFFPTAAFSTRKSVRKPTRFALPIAALPIAVLKFAVLAIVAGPVSAADVELKPYTAQYVTKAKGISLTLDRKLQRNDEGVYSLSNGGSKFIAGFQENSSFRVEESRIVPASYVYQGTGLMNRRREVQFTPGADTLRSLYKEKWYELPYTRNTFDRMSQQEQMRLVLMQDETPKETVIVTVADGKRIKDYQLDFVAEEVLDTPLGKVKTLHFERLHDDPDRKSDTWLAPDWDYMMVKTVHVEDGSPVTVKLVSASIDGVAIKGDK